MPKLPSVSGKDALKALSKVGFEFRRQAGSHMILKREKDGKRVVIPNHDELPKGTLRAISRQCDLTVESVKYRIKADLSQLVSFAHRIIKVQKEE